MCPDTQSRVDLIRRAWTTQSAQMLLIKSTWCTCDCGACTHSFRNTKLLVRVVPETINTHVIHLIPIFSHYMYIKATLMIQVTHNSVTSSITMSKWEVKEHYIHEDVILDPRFFLEGAHMYIQCLGGHIYTRFCLGILVTIQYSDIYTQTGVNFTPDWKLLSQMLYKSIASFQILFRVDTRLPPRVINKP